MEFYWIVGIFIAIYVTSYGYKIYKIEETEKRLRNEGADSALIESHVHQLRKEAEPGGCVSVIVGLIAVIAFIEFVL